MFSSLLRVATRSASIQLEELSAKAVPAAVAKAGQELERRSQEGKVDDEVLPIKEGDRIEGTPLAEARAAPLQPKRETVTADHAGVAVPPAVPSPAAPEVSLSGLEGRSAHAESSTAAAGRARAASILQARPPATSLPVQPVRQAGVRAEEFTPFPSSSSLSSPIVPPSPKSGKSPPPRVSTSPIDIRPAATDPGTAPEATDKEDAPILLRASRVPSSKIGRFLHYGSLAASLSWGAASETLQRSAGGGGAAGSSVFMSDANVRRLVSSLTKMRGAALKLGQFMSIQDNHMLPPEIERVLSQVQSHANYMPDWQMERVMSSELGLDWSSLFASFDRTPIASASIGQVHRATLPSGQTVAVKIQFPGIRDSITSDLSYLTPLLASSSILPKGLYLQNTIAVMKRELADECDYTKEAEAGRRFEQLLEGDGYFDTPTVIDAGCTERVLTTTWMEGKSLSRMKGMSQETRDRIGTNILRLCLQELFHFRFMQTDPNWGNFLYSPSTDRLGLIDFGASRAYSNEFMDGWFALLSAAIRGDRERMKTESRNIGYFTGEEEEVMIDAHLSSMSLLSVPFAHQGIYDFSHQTITDDVRKYIPIMLKHRLTPPPQETYSLNRKLSGAFLMCAKLGARVDCAQLWEEWAGGYPYSEPRAEV